MRKRYVLSMILIGMIGLGWGCAGMTYKPTGPIECNAKIKWDVAKEADITFLKCYQKMYSGWEKSVLHFEVGIKNKSDQPQRFRVQFILPEEGLAVGGLVPATGKPPVLDPGKEGKGVYPVNLETAPKKVNIVLKTITVEE
ncbi:MAG: hypothetical protein QME90_13575 [Thermodesulfobacteriota bacterium]|nr:hypothetical protein [Thermodesulfobacteriota bacterium]